RRSTDPGGRGSTAGPASRRSRTPGTATATATVRNPALGAGWCPGGPLPGGAASGLAAVVLVTGGSGGGGETTSEVGTVRSASGAQVRTSDGSEPRALEEGEAVLYGWSVE